MIRPKYLRISQVILTLISVIFGIITIVVGSGVVAGSDPGYKVFQPLLIYNTIMGFAYIATGILAWRNLNSGKYSAALVLTLNILMLCIIGYIYNSGNDVAIESIRAMVFRTVIWFLLFVGLFWINHKNNQLSNQNA